MDIAAWLTQGILAPIIGGVALLLAAVVTLRGDSRQSTSYHSELRRAQWWTQACWVLEHTRALDDQRVATDAFEALSRGPLREEHDGPLVEALTKRWRETSAGHILEVQTPEA